jgi:hypothetical protein
MLFEGGFSFTNFLTDLVTLFAFIVWSGCSLQSLAISSADTTSLGGVRRFG